MEFVHGVDIYGFGWNYWKLDRLPQNFSWNIHVQLKMASINFCYPLIFPTSGQFLVQYFNLLPNSNKTGIPISLGCPLYQALITKC